MARGPFQRSAVADQAGHHGIIGGEWSGRPPLLRVMLNDAAGDVIAVTVLPERHGAQVKFDFGTAGHIALLGCTGEAVG